MSIFQTLIVSALLVFAVVVFVRDAAGLIRATIKNNRDISQDTSARKETKKHNAFKC